jgi:hypothetical protein
LRAGETRRDARDVRENVRGRRWVVGSSAIARDLFPVIGTRPAGLEGSGAGRAAGIALR